jgi:hypothetical protein
METGKYFIFGKKEKIENEEEIIFIGKDGDFPSLEKYLEKEKGYNIYDFTKNHLNIQYFSDGDVFISREGITPLDIRLKEPVIPRKSLVIVEPKKKFETIIENKYEYTKTDYDIFSGDSIKDFSKNMKLKILTEIVLLSKVMYQMMRAGYLEMENKDRIDDWIVLFQEPILDIFIRYHKIESSAKDIPTSDEFVINPQYRKMICLTLMKILANFIVNNNYVKVEDVSQYESWENPDIWSYLKENVKIFKV